MANENENKEELEEEELDKTEDKAEEESKESEELEDDKESVEEKEEKEEDLSDAENQLLRLRADYANFRKRTEKERAGLIRYGVESIVEDLLPILDNFERAMESEKDKEDSFYKGIEMIQNQLLEMLKKNDIKEIDAEGEAFDPNYHYAVSMEESKDHKEGMIIGVVQKGYILEDKVIRPSMVRVAQ